MSSPVSETQLLRALDIVKGGGLIIIPTETFYGIACDSWSQAAVNRLVRIKGREWGKPIPLLVGSIEAARSAASTIPPMFEELAAQFWPGPLTLVIPAEKNFSSAITGGSGSIGIRIPGPSPTLDLARAFGRPLTATSANPAGQPPPRSFDEIDPNMASEVDLVLDGGRTPGDEPSTVLNLTTEQPTFLRPGSLKDEVEEFLKQR